MPEVSQRRGSRKIEILSNSRRTRGVTHRAAQQAHIPARTGAYGCRGELCSSTRRKRTTKGRPYKGERHATPILPAAPAAVKIRQAAGIHCRIELPDGYTVCAFGEQYYAPYIARRPNKPVPSLSCLPERALYAAARRAAPRHYLAVGTLGAVAGFFAVGQYKRRIAFNTPYIRCTRLNPLALLRRNAGGRNPPGHSCRVCSAG